MGERSSRTAISALEDQPPNFNSKVVRYLELTGSMSNEGFESRHRTASGTKSVYPTFCVVISVH